jgi:superfamily II DNA or RNA helicase
MINKNLSEVQIEALGSLYDSFKNNINPICAVGTGSGKTWIACEVISEIINDNNKNYRILVIHKASNYDDPWLKELRSYGFINDANPSADKQSKYIYLHGKNRDKYLIGGKYHFPRQIIVLTSYETLRLDIERGYYSSFDLFDLIIYDELHTIINYKRLTKRSKAISRLQAGRKLALTASPMNNYDYEFGIQYAFLNDSAGFSELIELFSHQKNGMNEKKNKHALLEMRLTEYIKLCVKHDFIFYYVEKKSGFQKNAVILSLPIDENMLIKLDEMRKSPIPKKRKFLSNPSTVFDDEDVLKLFYCAKERAVIMILQSMLNNEKAVIFSSYKIVLDVYFDICQNIGFPAIAITGDDKGAYLDNKLNVFKNSDKIRVLLTTLQKSAEGFNFYYATHVIILEFWWNPHKILQAMSRVDRKTQTRNIFIYILCYNKNGEMINLEKMYYDKMVLKISAANKVFQEIEENHPKKNPELQTEYADIPEIQIFLNITAINKELKKYIAQFQHTEKKELLTYELKGSPLLEVKGAMENEANYYLNNLITLKDTPWMIKAYEMKKFLDNFYKLNISTNNNILFNKAMEEDIRNFNIKRNLNPYYQIVFIDKVIFKIRMVNGSKKTLPSVILIGKMKNGKYDLIGIYYFKEDIFPYIFSDLKERGVVDIKITLSNMNLWNIIKDTLPGIFPMAISQICMIDLIQQASKHKISWTINELRYIENIFSANTINEALRICTKTENAVSRNKYIFKRLYGVLSLNRELFEYMPNDRKNNGTINIITYIINYLDILLNKGVFINIEEFITFIHYTSDLILQNGKKFIPNWDIMTAPIDQISSP